MPTLPRYAALLEQFRRTVAPARAPAPLTGPSPQAEARRLLAMLESQPDGLRSLAKSKQLRRVASELVQRVEADRARSSNRAVVADKPVPLRLPAPAPTPKLSALPKPAPKAPPLSVPPPKPAPAPPSTADALPIFKAAPPRFSSVRPKRGAGAEPAPVETPAQAPQPLSGPKARPVPLGVDKTALRRMAQVAMSSGTLAQEHPAIAAVALRGRSKREQALVLRALPGPKARAVHRLLGT